MYYIFCYPNKYILESQFHMIIERVVQIRNIRITSYDYRTCSTDMYQNLKSMSTNIKVAMKVNVSPNEN